MMMSATKSSARQVVISVQMDLMRFLCLNTDRQLRYFMYKVSISLCLGNSDGSFSDCGLRKVTIERRITYIKSVM